MNYRIPHGVAVTIGMLVENEIAFHRGILAASDRDRMVAAGRQLVPSAARDEFTAASFSRLLALLRLDKKTDGHVLKLVVPERLGQVRFIDFELNNAAEILLADCVRSVIKAL